MFERFTERARQVVVLAQDEARALKHNYAGTEHILLGLLREQEGLAARALESLDITIEEVREKVERIIAPGSDAVKGQIPFTPRAQRVLDLSLKEALSLSHSYIGTEHILLGLVRENEGVAARILLDFDADAEKVRAEVIHRLAGPARSPVSAESDRTLTRPGLREDLAAAVEDAKQMLAAKQEFEEAVRLRDLQRRLDQVVEEMEASLARVVREHELSVRRDRDARWEYDVRMVAGPSDTWAEQLSAWREDGWELLTIVEEGGGRRALLERRVP